MEEENRIISPRIVKLITGFFHFVLTEQEKDELDEWTCASDDNENIFGVIIEIASLTTASAKGKVYSPGEILDETRLIRYMNKIAQGIATEEEKYDLAAYLQKKDKLFRHIFDS